MHSSSSSLLYFPFFLLQFFSINISFLFSPFVYFLASIHNVHHLYFLYSSSNGQPASSHSISLPFSVTASLSLSSLHLPRVFIIHLTYSVPILYRPLQTLHSLAEHLFPFLSSSRVAASSAALSRPVVHAPIHILTPFHFRLSIHSPIMYSFRRIQLPCHPGSPIWNATPPSVLSLLFGFRLSLSLCRCRS